MKNMVFRGCHTCTDEILAGLGKMYVTDERFKRNIGTYGDGTAEFAAETIAQYSKQVKGKKTNGEGDHLCNDNKCGSHLVEYHNKWNPYIENGKLVDDEMFAFRKEIGK